MRGNCDLVFGTLGCGPDANVASRLPDFLVTIPAKQPCQFRAGKITRQFHAPPQATMTSSFTMCSRMSLGLRSEEHTSELQSHLNLVCRLLLEKKKTNTTSDSQR